MSHLMTLFAHIPTAADHFVNDDGARGTSSKKDG
jgi:hypothetical protein